MPRANHRPLDERARARLRDAQRVESDAAAGCGSVDHSQLTYAALGYAVRTAVQTTKLRDDGTSIDQREAEEQILGATIAGLATAAHELTRRGKGMLDVAEALKRAAAAKRPCALD